MVTYKLKRRVPQTVREQRKKGNREMNRIMQKGIWVLAVMCCGFVAHASVITLKGTSNVEDVVLRTDVPQKNYGGANWFMVGKLVAGATNNTLLRFTDLSAASGQTVTNATLRLYKTDWSNQTADVTVNIYQVAAANAGWVEGAGLGTLVDGTSDWSWKIQTVNTPWAGGQNSGCGKAGTDYTISLVGSVTALDATAGYIDINLDASVIQNWIDNPSQNYGLILTAPGATAGQVVWFNSSEAGSGNPELVLNVIPEPVTSGLLGVGGLLVLILRRVRS